MFLPMIKSQENGVRCYCLHITLSYSDIEKAKSHSFKVLILGLASEHATNSWEDPYTRVDLRFSGSAQYQNLFSQGY